MTFYEFKSLELNEQAQFTWDNSVLIGHREDNELYMTLYRIDNFYVEIQYHRDQNEIVAIKSFSSDEPLTPYLNKTDLTSLF